MTVRDVANQLLDMNAIAFALWAIGIAGVVFVSVVMAIAKRMENNLLAQVERERNILLLGRHYRD